MEDWKACWKRGYVKMWLKSPKLQIGFPLYPFPSPNYLVVSISFPSCPFLDPIPNCSDPNRVNLRDSELAAFFCSV